MEENEKFNVYFFYPNGTYTLERSNLPAEDAVKFAHQATKRPAALLGILAQIMITDNGDFCCFHWKYGEGVVFPKPGEQNGKV